MVHGTGVCRSCPPNAIIRPQQTLGEEACIPCGPNTDENKVRRDERSVDSSLLSLLLQAYWRFIIRLCNLFAECVCGGGLV